MKVSYHNTPILNQIKYLSDVNPKGVNKVTFNTEEWDKLVIELKKVSPVYSKAEKHSPKYLYGIKIEKFQEIN